MTGRRQRQRRQAGLTIIEIMLVLIILMMVIGSVVVFLLPRQSEAQINTTRLRLNEIDRQIQLYTLHIGRPPTEDEGLRGLIRRPQFENEALASRWQGPYLDPDYDFTDPWGNQLRYELRQNEDGQGGGGRPYRLFSLGPDGQPDTDDDIYARPQRSTTDDL